MYVHGLIKCLLPQIRPCSQVLLHTTPSIAALQIKETVKGDIIEIDVEEIASGREHKLLRHTKPHSTCILSDRHLKNLRFDDVLILEQFLRKDGTVLPRSVTGLSKRNHIRIEALVMQAHWAGLFPNHKPANPDEQINLTGYRKYNRLWESDQDLYSKKLQTRHGSWFYIKRYR